MYATAMSLPIPDNNTMLTVLVQDFNTFTQEFYNSVIFSLPFHSLRCSCGHFGCLTIHGYYVRSVITAEGKTPLTICRLRCTQCHHTHALLLSSIVAYSQIPSEIQRTIAVCYEEGSDRNRLCTSADGIDENNVKSVIHRYVRFWRERLCSSRIGLSSLPELVKACFSDYSMQFMQIRPTPNILFSQTT